eukprot:17961-Heterococcus_DN1.PRE.1
MAVGIETSRYAQKVALRTLSETSFSVFLLVITASCCLQRDRAVAPVWSACYGSQMVCNAVAEVRGPCAGVAVVLSVSEKVLDIRIEFVSHKAALMSTHHAAYHCVII